jgi:TetR/AcrR family transcriptional regulator, tetracycline repressor protein
VLATGGGDGPLSCRSTLSAISTVDPKESPTRRARGRPPSLSESDIVAAGLTLIRHVGLQNLSMRALARELGVPPMTIYNYVASKEALRELVVNHILREIRIPGADEGTWEERIRQLEREVRRVLSRHPGVSAQLRDGGIAEGTRLAKGVLEILNDGGFSPDAAVLCFATLYTFMIGQIDLDAMAAAIDDRSPRASLEGVAPLAQFSRDELFEFGFDVVIAGLKLKLLG